MSLLTEVVVSVELERPTVTMVGTTCVVDAQHSVDELEIIVSWLMDKQRNGHIVIVEAFDFEDYVMPLRVRFVDKGLAALFKLTFG